MPARKKKPGGPKEDKIWRDALMRAVRRRIKNSKKAPQALEEIADIVVSQAMTGDMKAVKEIGDRLDGKPSQALDVKTATEIHVHFDVDDAKL